MRIRFRFAKLGKIRFTGQRDVARMWERALRRAGLPVAYTEGFSPRPAAQLRTGPPHRVRVPGRVRRRGPRRSPGRGGRRRGGRPSRPAHRSAARRHRRRRGRSGRSPRRLPATDGHLLFVGDELHGVIRDPSSQPRWTRCWRRRRSPSIGSGREDRSTTTSGPRCGPWSSRMGRGTSRPWPTGSPADAIGRASMAELATQPRGVRPIELVRGLSAVSGGTATAVGPGDGTTVRGHRESRCWTGHAERNSGSSATASVVSPSQSVGCATGDDRAAHALERAS